MAIKLAISGPVSIISVMATSFLQTSVTAVGAHENPSAFFALNVQLGILNHGLSGFISALIVCIVAHNHLVEQSGARCPQCEKHGQKHDDNDDVKGYALVGFFDYLA